MSQSQIAGNRFGHEAEDVLHVPLPDAFDLLFAVFVGTVVLAIALLLALFATTYTPRISVAGQLVPVRGIATVHAPATGVVKWLGVDEGMRIVQGDAVALVQQPYMASAAGTAPSMVELRAAALRPEQDQALPEVAGHGQDDLTLAAAVDQLAQLRAERSTRLAQLRVANEALVRVRSLQEPGHASVLQLDQQRVLVLEYTVQLQSLQRQMIVAQEHVRRLRRMRSVSATPSTGVLAESSQPTHVKDQSAGGMVVTAPVDGIVSAIVTKPGQSVQRGQPLLSMVPGDGRLQAELLVPSHAAGTVAAGDKVQLRYQSFPPHRFGHHSGVVAGVSGSALGPAEVAALWGRSQPGGPFYRVTVELDEQSVVGDGTVAVLKAGMLLEADLIGERRRVIDWLLGSLQSLQRGRHGAWHADGRQVPAFALAKRTIPAAHLLHNSPLAEDSRRNCAGAAIPSSGLDCRGFPL